MDYNSAGIDLHIHSTASDGCLTPSEILDLAVGQGLRAFSLTDHDSVEGAKELEKKKLPEKIKFLSGVEISAAPPPSFNLPGSLHLLGYGMDVNDRALNQALDRQQQARINRTPEMIARLKALGFPVTLSRLREQSGNKQLGRPHLARWMVANGYAESIDAAFDRYLGKNGPAYVEKPRIPMQEAVQLIRSAGGVAVLAHPGLIELTDDSDYERLIRALVAMGVQGIEVYYPKHSPAQQVFFENTAEKLGLLVTGGSDFHGDTESGIKPGRGTGDLHVPYGVYEKIIHECRPKSQPH